MDPIFREETMAIWAETFNKLDLERTRILLLGVAAMSYDEKRVSMYREFLRRFPPFILTSRDAHIFHILGDLVAINFDKIPEPKISFIDKSDLGADHQNRFIRTFRFNNKTWQLKFPVLRTKIAESSRYLMFLEGVLFRGNNTSKIGDYHLIRTDHRPHPMIKCKTYRERNVLVNDVPYPYFEIYNQAEITLSNRIHACVAALSYGKSAMLFSRSPRLMMLERLGLSEITQHPCRLDESRLDQEKYNLEKFLTKALS